MCVVGRCAVETFEILALLGLSFEPFGLVVRQLSQFNLDALIPRLVIFGVARVSSVALTVDLAGIGDVGLRLDGAFILFSVHVAQLLFLTKHTLFILSNLLLITRDVIPVDLTRALVHRVLIQALHLLTGIIDYFAHHNSRLIFVPIVVRSCQILRPLDRVRGHLNPTGR